MEDDRSNYSDSPVSTVCLSNASGNDFEVDDVCDDTQSDTRRQGTTYTTVNVTGNSYTRYHSSKLKISYSTVLTEELIAVQNCITTSRICCIKRHVCTRV